MNRIVRHISLMLACILLSCMQGSAQPGVFFKLPVDVEDDAYASSMYAVADYTKTAGQTSLKNYSGNDADIRVLSKIIDAVNNEKRGDYNMLSDPADTTAEGSFDFYRIFLPRSKDPRLHSTVRVGNRTLYFVKLDVAIPPIVFCLVNKNGNYLNNPLFLDQKVTTAITTGVVMNYVMPEEFNITKDMPASNLVVYYDSVMGVATASTRFMLDTAHVYFNLQDVADTANYFDPKYKAILEHYRKTLKLLDEENLEGYFNMFSAESSERLKKSFAMSKDKAEALSYYKKYKNSYSIVTGILDLDKVQILLVTNSDEYQIKKVQTVYMLQEDKQVKWINENKEFYLDELLRTEEFQNVLIEKNEEGEDTK